MAVIIEPTPPESCELCGETAECRPYGPKGEKICVECGDKDPGTYERVKAAMRIRLETVALGPEGN